MSETAQYQRTPEARENSVRHIEDPLKSGQCFHCNLRMSEWKARPFCPALTTHAYKWKNPEDEKNILLYDTRQEVEEHNTKCGCCGMHIDQFDRFPKCELLDYLNKKAASGQMFL